MSQSRPREMPPELSSDEDSSRELIKLVRKLRWIGKDDEARKLERAITCTSMTDSVLASPPDTD